MSEETLAHYTIRSKLGEGGMGVVYLATDTKLGRDVALKLLVAGFADDPERLERLRREARSLASLSHPNIGAIHGIEESEGKVALVLELIEGETLEERLARGPIEREEAVAIATQIASALEAAHERGIVHRDLKPANIKITPSGQVKVLDFGLAKTLQREAADAEISHSPTLTMTAAMPGLVIGTPHYMSPEQAKGQVVDRRADIWAFGAVCFEMLTRERLFGGSDLPELLAAVISREPDLSRLPPDTPARWRELIGRCLRRDLSMRLPDIAVARIAFEEGIFDDDETAPPRRSGAGLNGIVAVGALVAGAVLGVVIARAVWAPSVVPVRTTQVEVVLDPPPLPDALPTVSRDGLSIAYAANTPGARGLLHIRSLDDGATRSIPGSENAGYPEFSPDGRSLAFIAAGRLKVVDIRGGLPRPLTAIAGSGSGIAWLDDDTIVYDTMGAPVPLRIPASGGEPKPVAVDDAGVPDLLVTHPERLSGTDAILVTASSRSLEGSRIAALSLSDGKLTLLDRGSNAKFVAPSLVVYPQLATLVTAPFDPRRLVLTGPARAVTPSGVTAVMIGQASGDLLLGEITPEGHALLPLQIPEQRSLVWVDRDGTETPIGLFFDAGTRQDGAASGALSVSLSPDGRKVAVLTGGLTVIDLQDVTRRRTLATLQGDSAYPRWDRSGKSVSFISTPEKAFFGYRAVLDGDGGPERITTVPQSITTSWFPGDRKVLGYVVSETNSRDLWVFDLDGEAEPLLQTPANERAPMLSPDGRAFAYVSDESGRDEVYLRLYPDSGQVWQISREGGTEPLWSRDGSELYFRSAQALHAVRISLDAGVSLGLPETLFVTDSYEQDPFGNTTYDVNDAGRFLMVRYGEGSRNWRLIQNWNAQLQALTAR